MQQNWLDLYRITKTSLPGSSEKEYRDIWDPSKPQKEMSAPWVGETIFEIDHPRAKQGYKWEGGRETTTENVSATLRHTPSWKHLNQAARNREITSWKAQADERAQARKNRGLLADDCAPDLELLQYRKALESLSKCKDEVALASVVNGNPDQSSRIVEMFADEAYGRS